ncbi:tripartite tricarboxylate transporter TctB family protein [Acidimangrovimonas sediminis]|uniref:tripartite tricarboxylate transporter TctB family protein n=1 Tax=Acidimangrovimonas sediminis TaxID=2056283 RepID=UPI000C7FEAA6|nr:tripartite tricarboxylate transporter TctB family protein [Acidimangrovimonas sediminis]
MSQHLETDHHDGTSDATPGGYEDQKRPGETAFAVIMLLASLGLLWNAYGIAGFTSLSSPGAIPMATTFVMVVAAAIVLVHTIRLPKATGETFVKDILPGTVLLFVVFLVCYGVLLEPLGFILTSALFLVAAIKVLWRRSWAVTLGVAAFSLLLIWLVFRIVFTVLMPEGVVPEAEIIQTFRNLFTGGAS